MAPDKHPVEIALICDDNYVTPTCVVIQSLIETKKIQTFYNIHIICASLTEENVDTFLRFNSDTVHIHIIFQDADLLASLHTFEENTYCVATPAALFKFKLPELLPSLEKVLYLDGDILVREDLSDLFETKLGNAYLAAVLDSGIMYFRNKYIDQVGQYFNSGVMLINLAQMREDSLTEKLIQAKVQMHDSSLMDQNVFNCTCAGRVVFLPIRYNFLPINLLRASEKWSLTQLNQLYGTEYANESCLFRDAAIIHFASKDKPWKDDSVAFADDWFRCYYAAPLNHTLCRSHRADIEPGTPKISILFSETEAAGHPCPPAPEEIEFLYGPEALDKAAGQYIWLGRHCDLPGLNTLAHFYDVAVSNNLDVVFGDVNTAVKQKVYPTTYAGQVLYSLLTHNDDYFACPAGGLYRRDFLQKHQLKSCNAELFIFSVLCYAERTKTLNITICNRNVSQECEDRDCPSVVCSMLEMLRNTQVTEDFIHAAAININHLLNKLPSDFEISASSIVPILALHTPERFPSNIDRIKEYRAECEQLKKDKAARWEELQALYKEKGERWEELQTLYKEKGERWKELQALYKEKGERWKELTALRKEKSELTQELKRLQKENADLHAKMNAGIFPGSRIRYRIRSKISRFLSKILSKFRKGV